MNTRAHIWISGKVQGVFYRDNTRRWATSLGLSGWVKNLPDGRVEVLVEGEKDTIESLEKKLKVGSPLSRVDDVRTEWEEYKGVFFDFQIM